MITAIRPPAQERQLALLASKPKLLIRMRITFLAIYLLASYVFITTYFMDKWPFAVSPVWVILLLAYAIEAPLLSKQDLSLAFKPMFVYEIFFYAYMAWCFAAAPLGLDPGRAVRRALSLPLVYFFLKLNIVGLGSGGIRRLMPTFAAIGTLYSVVSLIAYRVAPPGTVLYGELDIYTPQGRFWGLTGNPNPSAMLAVCALLYQAMAFSCAQTVIMKLFLTLCGCASLAVTLMTASRTSISAAGIFFIVLSTTHLLSATNLILLRALKKKSMRFLTFLIFTAAISAGFFFMQREIHFDRLFLRGREKIEIDRSLIWRNCIEYTRDHNYLTGVGFGNAGLVLTQFGWAMGTAHNMIVDAFLETGLIGVWILALMVLALFLDAFHRVTTTASTMGVVSFAGLVALFANSMTEQLLGLPLVPTFFTFFFLFFVLDKAVPRKPPDNPRSEPKIRARYAALKQFQLKREVGFKIRAINNVMNCKRASNGERD